MKNGQGEGNSANLDNVIDMTERIQEPDFKLRLKNLKVRFDLEQAKIAISTSLLSIVVLVTMANNNLLSTNLESGMSTQASRGIASVPTGTTDAEDNFIHELGHHELTSAAGLGHKSSALDELTMGTLEGKYSVKIRDGKVSTLEFSATDTAPDAKPTLISDLTSFLDANRALLPVEYSRSLKVGREARGESFTETYQLVDRVSKPVGRVQFVVDAQGRLLAMHVGPDQIVPN
jgi:hypothetical protein